jgi:putative DNA methylase
MTYKKKLIEVALPLDAINREAREKTIIHGHPSTLHLWWSRKPLATSRAVLFASLIDDPSEHSDRFPTEQDQERERERIFGILEELIQWKNSNNKDILEKSCNEIHKSIINDLPVLLDPFAGGGSIPLEAQRLGLVSYANDLNPVAVLINKALIDLPAKFADLPPINPDYKNLLIDQEWDRVQGLAADIRYYGKWMRDQAELRIGNLYPKALVPKEYGGGEATIIAWLWVRTVKCPNPACGAQIPLASKWWLSKRKNQEVWIEPIVDYDKKTVHFKVCTGNITKKLNEVK